MRFLDPANGIYRALFSRFCRIKWAEKIY